MSDMVEVEIDDEVATADDQPVEVESALSGVPQEVIDNLTLFLQEELQIVNDDEERSEFLRKVDAWRRQRLAEPQVKVRNDPWEKSANTSVPTVMRYTNGMFAKLKAFIEARHPRVEGKSYNAKSKLLAEVAADVLNYLNSSPFHVNLGGLEQKMLYDFVSLGTQVVEWDFVVERRNIRRNGVTETKVVRQGPRINVYAIEDVMVRLNGTDDVQKMPWIGFRNIFYGYELRRHAASGFFDPEIVEDVLSSSAVSEAPHENMEKRDARLGITPQYEGTATDTSMFQVFKCYVQWDVDNDGITEEVIVWYDYESGKILRIEFNEVGVRLISVGRYLTDPAKFYGVGVGRMCHDLQEEIDTFHRLRINTQALSSVGVVIEKTGSQQFNRGLAIKPGARFQADDPHNDYVVFKFPDVTASTLTGEQIAQQHAEKAIGASESMFGQPDTVAKSGTSFSLQNLQASRGDSIFVSIANSVVDWYNDIFQKELMIILANGDAMNQTLSDLYDQTQDKAKYDALQQLLQMNPEDIPAQIAFQVRTTDIQKTDEAKRQNFLMHLQSYTMISDKLLQLVPLLSQQIDDETRRLVMAQILGYSDILKKFKELIGDDNAEDAVMNVELYRVMAEILDSQHAQQAGLIKAQYEQARREQELGGPVGATTIESGGIAEPADAGFEGATATGGGPMAPEGEGSLEAGI